MKKIIDGKMYNTDTAKEIAVDKDFNDNVCKTTYLTYYKKKTGEFFTHFNGWTTWGNIYEYEKITPISEEHAKLTLEDLLSVSDYEELFGAVEE